ncbi:MAG TPA: MtrB/PioB family outer membrane beta-barrel protein [Geobacteraceae bacterium]|nr:MtrB/PioB family outer membrane beta-barrel protein [Geobacteraceae bacterium]
MKRKGSKLVALTIFLSGLGAVGTVHADMDIMGGKATLSGESNVAVQQKYVNGSEQKFEEYRDVQNGVVLQDLRLRIDGNTIPYYLDLKVMHPALSDEFYRLQGGQYGKFGIELFYDSIPHNYATGTLILSGAGTDNLTIANQIQQDMQANELLTPARGTNPLAPNPQDAAQQAITTDLLANTNTTVFAFKREKAGFSVGYNFTDDIKSWARVTNEKKTGTRVITIGDYERYPQIPGGPHISDLFLVAGTELAEPIQYRTTVLNVGTGIYKKEWLADIQYTFTNFDNEDSTLRWDNPYRSTSISSSNFAGATNTSNGDFNRGRFTMGQLDLVPSSQSHDITLSGSVELPAIHGRFTGTVSYGMVFQNDSFLPYTLNAAVSGTNVPAFAGPANITDPATVLATSGHSSLNGDVRTITQSYVFTCKPVEPLTVTAKYRYYDYDNLSDAITFPGYAAFSESFWRTGNNDPRATANAGAPSSPLSYTRQNAGLVVDYHLFKPLTVTVEGGWEGWDRENLRINSTDELGIGGGFLYKPIKAVIFSGRYRYAHRTVNGYEPGNTAENPEAVGQVNFDWADRIRHRVDARLAILPVQSVTIGVTWQYLKDDYGGNNPFGLKSSESLAGAIDVAYRPSDIVTLYASYVQEYSKGAMQSAAKDNAVAGQNYFPRNFWNSDIYDKAETVGTGVTVQVIPGKLTLNTSYNLSFTKTEFSNTNPNLASDTLQNAIAQAWPPIRNRYQEVRVDIGYNLTKKLKVGVAYLYEWYKLDDFVNTPAYMAGLSAENSTKFVFTGANQYSYEANVAGAYVSYTF